MEDVHDDDDGPAVLGELLEGISVVSIGGDRFRGPTPTWFFGDRVFGGVIVAQALFAALQTVDARIRPHSLHGYFMRAVRPGEPVEISVDRLRDGRTFSTRHVAMRQGDRIVFWMTCSFHADEPGEEYQFAMRDDLPAPEELSQSPFAPGPFLVRDIGATAPAADGTMTSTRRVWFRCTDDLTDDPVLHVAVGAYLSDVSGNSFRPLTLDSWDGYTDASLDHALWFHRPFRADKWLYYDLQAVVNAGGRSLVRGAMYQDGQLCLSMAQELLIRPFGNG